jgi:diacylglycerol kinase (ATP)
MTARHLLIVNPRSAGGSTGRRWQEIERQLRSRLPPFDIAFTKCPRHGTRLAADAVRRYEVVVAVGGDGTVDEVVNGLVDEAGAVRPDVALGFIPLGTGADFVRSLGIPRGLEQAAAVLARGQRREIDVGRACFRAFDGGQAVRYFVNEAEVGLGATVCEMVNRSSKRFGGAVTFLLATIVAMLRYQARPVSFVVDGKAPETIVLDNVWIANGSYSGGGIRSAPRARLDDGLLDLVRVGHARPLERLRGLLKMRSGAFVELPQVDYRAVRRVEASAETAVPVEVGGELVGTVPATFDLLPARLPVIA